MTVKERLDAIAASGWPIAYDGCHKIYFLPDEERETEVREHGGYEIHPSSEVERLYRGSCGLRFVSRWWLGNEDPGHQWNIEQFEEG